MTASTKRLLRLNVRLTLMAVALATAAVLGAPGVAAAATGTLSVTGPDPSGGIDASATIGVTQADCTSYGYCGWFVVLTAAPANQSCAIYQSSELVAVGPLEPTTGAVSQPFHAPLFGQSPFDLCLFIDLPTAIGTYQLLAQTSYSVPSPTATISSQLEPGGAIGGTITVTQPYCALGCFWDATATGQDGAGACAASPASFSAWTGPVEFASGTYSWPYSFTPDISTGTETLCVYVGQQLVGSGTFTFPASAPPASGTQGHLLTLVAARNALRQALRRKYRNAHNFAFTCARVTTAKVRCQVRFARAGRQWAGTAIARLSGNLIYWRANVGPTRPAASPPPRPTSPTPTPTPTPRPTPSPTPTGCYPLSNEGTCYEPGEYCRNDDHGVSGVAGDGEAITCEDNNGWRWEPT